jgi:hypothetical protein
MPLFEIEIKSRSSSWLILWSVNSVPRRGGPSSGVVVGLPFVSRKLIIQKRCNRSLFQRRQLVQCQQKLGAAGCPSWHRAVVKLSATFPLTY